MRETAEVHSVRRLRTVKSRENRTGKKASKAQAKAGCAKQPQSDRKVRLTIPLRRLGLKAESAMRGKKILFGLCPVINNFKGVVL